MPNEPRTYGMKWRFVHKDKYREIVAGVIPGYPAILFCVREFDDDGKLFAANSHLAPAPQGHQGRIVTP